MTSAPRDDSSHKCVHRVSIVDAIRKSKSREMNYLSTALGIRMSDLKVAMLTYSTRARGGVAHALKLAERLRGLGADLTLYALARDDDPVARAGFYREVAAPFRILDYEWDPDMVTRLERMIKAYSDSLPRDTDVYHAQDCVGATALMRMKEDGHITAPVFRTIHHVDDFAEPRLFEFEKRAVENAEHRFVVSQYWKTALKRDYGFDSIVTYNGLDREDFADLPTRRSKTPNILFVGGLEARKGLEHLVLAMTGVVRELPNARLTAIGKTGFRGNDEQGWFRVLANRAGVDGSVDLNESVSQGALMQMYADCDLVVLPSRNEGWGLSLMEAMACAKPVVATKVGGIPELVRDGVEGVLVESGDVKGLSDAIVRLLRDPGERARMGAAGQQRVAQFSWDRTALTVLDAYRSAL